MINVKLKNILLKPFQLLMNMIIFIINNFFYGIIVSCWCVYFVINKIFMLITLPIRIVINKTKESEKYKEKQNEQKNKNLTKQEKQMLKQKEKERKYLEEQERIAERKRKNEDSVVFAEVEKKTINENIGGLNASNKQ